MKTKGNQDFNKKNVKAQMQENQKMKKDLKTKMMTMIVNQFFQTIYLF